MAGRSIYFLGAIGACICAAVVNATFPGPARAWLGFWLCLAIAFLGYWIGNSEKDHGMSQIGQWLKSRFQKSDSATETAVTFDGSRESLRRIVAMLGDDFDSLGWVGHDVPQFVMKNGEKYVVFPGDALVRGPTGFFARKK